jgi:pimeloyl-ACP methyl ester carboxylesterase
MTQDTSTFALADGRELDLHTAGPADGRVLLYFHGTPGSGHVDDALVQAAADRGLRIVSWSRPGYSTSTRHPGRSIASVAADAAEVLDHLGAQTALAAGWSGGGPHALAVGALLAGRVQGVACLAGVAPYAESAGSLDFLAGMGQDNLDEFGAAMQGEVPVREYLETVHVEALRVAQGSEIVEQIGSLLPEVDRAWIGAEFGDDLATSFHEALAVSADGWVDDDLAFVRPWGFDLGAIAVPVALWQGSEDLMVPFAHGRWLAQAMPQARAHLLDGDGHLSVVLGRVGEILDDLVAHA